MGFHSFIFLANSSSNLQLWADVSSNLLLSACMGHGLDGKNGADGRVRWIGELRRGDCPHALRTVFITCTYLYLFCTVKRVFRHLNERMSYLPYPKPTV